ncbi:MAG: hypothetical protein M3O46_20975 [Myxococcota bacterium]|nr:hypothetical protein [Myxococcota bacterium]
MMAAAAPSAGAMKLLHHEWMDLPRGLDRQAGGLLPRSCARLHPLPPLQPCSAVPMPCCPPIATIVRAGDLVEAA